jgi:hypothetical protein
MDSEVFACNPDLDKPSPISVSDPKRTSRLLAEIYLMKLGPDREKLS